MAIARQPAPSEVLTYERYLAEDEIKQRYDIVDGERIYMPGPDYRHQEILMNTMELLRDYQRTRGRGKTIIAPFDILIHREPLRTRQPDVLFISSQRLTQSGERNLTNPLTVAPELVVEIQSPTETARLLDESLPDYRAIGVLECWVIRSNAQTVEVVRLSPEGRESVAIYGHDQTLQSVALPDLTLAVADIFAKEPEEN